MRQHRTRHHAHRAIHFLRGLDAITGIGEKQRAMGQNQEHAVASGEPGQITDVRPKPDDEGIELVVSHLALERRAARGKVAKGHAPVPEPQDAWRRGVAAGALPMARSPAVWLAPRDRWAAGAAGALASAEWKAVGLQPDPVAAPPWLRRAAAGVASWRASTSYRTPRARGPEYRRGFWKPGACVTLQ